MRHIRTKEIIIVSVALVVVIIIGIFTSSKHLKDYPLPNARVATSTQSSAIKLVSFSHLYNRGTYTFKGSITVPTVCYIASAKTSLIPSTTPQVIDLNITIPIDTGRCLQLPATTTFSVTQQSQKVATARVYVNSILATSTNL